MQLCNFPALWLLPVFCLSVVACFMSRTPDGIVPSIRENVVLKGKRSWLKRRFPCLCIAFAILSLIFAVNDKELDGDVPEDFSSLVLIVDLSGSMEAREVLVDSDKLTMDCLSKSRIERTIELVLDILEKWDGRVGLVVFAQRAYLASPIVSSRRIIAERVKMLSPLEYEDGTAIAEALDCAVAALNNSGVKHGIAYLFSDGADHSADGKLEKALRNCVENGVTVNVVGIGSERAAHSVTDTNGEVTWKLIGEKTNEVLLRKISENTGGDYYFSSGDKSLPLIKLQREGTMHKYALCIAVALFLILFSTLG